MSNTLGRHWSLVVLALGFGLPGGCGRVSSNGASSDSGGSADSGAGPGSGGEGGGNVPITLSNPVHVAAEADEASADGTEEHPFPLLDDAAAAIARAGKWQGTILVHAGRYEHPTSDVVLLPNSALEIQAGTTFALGPNVALHVQGDVKAIGTEEKPIVFTWLSEGQHWGAFTLTGASSADNVFEYAHFEHGYQTMFDGFSRSGALSLYQSVARISHCIFSENEGSDTLLLEASASHVEFSEFTHNASDALQTLDTLDGLEIDNNSFLANGNDGIHMYRSVAYIHENLISGSRDKGISIADGTSATIEHNLIVGNGTGIVHRDDSKAVVNNNTLVGNAYGITYAGTLPGKGTLTNNIVWGSSSADLWLEPGHQLDITYSCIENTSNAYDDSNYEGEGILTTGAGCDDPLFADPGGGDYHLQSEAGRFDAATRIWIKDNLTSPCIDAGRPGDDVGDEPVPNGSRINLGYDGGTAEASRSP